MHERVRKLFYRACFRRAAKAVLGTPPLRLRPSRLMFVCLTCHRDVHAFLLAMKSVYRQFGEGRICALDDGSLTPGDRDTIAAQLLGVEFLDAAGIEIAGTPSYIVWRRLTCILNLIKEHYVVQIDSDVLATGDISDAVDVVGKNRPFLLVNRVHPGLVTFAEMSRWISAQPWYSESLQVEFEKRLESFSRADEKRYVRGSAGFTGWPKGSASLEQARDFSGEALKLVGDRWLRWGSEQITTNYLLANAPDLVMLGHPNYINYMPTMDPASAALIHFFGTFRYHDAQYTIAARKVIGGLQSTGG